MRYSLKDEFILAFAVWELPGFRPKLLAPAQAQPLARSFWLPFWPAGLSLEMHNFRCSLCAWRTAATRAEKAAASERSPGQVVIDELVGVLACYPAIRKTPVSADFHPFLSCSRVFDIIKPWPVSASEKLAPQMASA